MIAATVNLIPNKTNVLLIGKYGQLARTLIDTAPYHIKLLSLARNDINLLNTADIDKTIVKFNPAVVINTAAYTHVDKAELEPNEAFLVNNTYVENIATVTSKKNIRLIHISSDFVFGGNQTRPYTLADIPSPLSAYGASKFAGEQALTRLQPNNAAIIRTSWLYSPYGHNFVKTMLDLMSHKAHLRVVNDQIGSPTNAYRLAQFIWQLTTLDTLAPLYHWSDVGSTSWYDFAITIQEIGLTQGLLRQKIPINSILSSDYPSHASRPKYSVLDTSVSQSILAASHWREELADFLKEMGEKRKITDNG